MDDYIIKWHTLAGCTTMAFSNCIECTDQDSAGATECKNCGGLFTLKDDKSACESEYN